MSTSNTGKKQHFAVLDAPGKHARTDAITDANRSTMALLSGVKPSASTVLM